MPVTTTTGTPRGRRRPAVLDAARTALIPLRPLTIGEVLDGAFLIVRRNFGAMLGLPLILAGALAAYILIIVVAWIILGETTSDLAGTVVAVLMGVVGAFMLIQCLNWVSAVLCRVSLQTVLGPGFAPNHQQVGLRSALKLFWPMLGLALLHYVALMAIQTAIGMIFYALTFAGIAINPNIDESWLLVLSIMVSIVTFLASALAYGYLALTVPAMAVESRHSPGWIGKPMRPTNPITAFQRSFQLVGRSNLMRVTAINAATLLICVLVIGLLTVGFFGLLALFLQTFTTSTLTLLIENPWVVGGVVVFAGLVSLSALLAFAASVQSLLYLDLRMRREALDLAMRFDAVPIPQPVAPPKPVFLPYGYPPPPGYGALGHAPPASQSQQAGR